MARRLAAAAIGIALVGAGCGGHGSSSADSVARYIDDVNRIQRELVVPLGAVTQQSRALSGGAKLETLRPQLGRSVSTIGTLERRIDALEPPAEAQRLDALVRETVHDEWELTHELALLAGYVHAAGPPLARAGAAGKRLRTEVRPTKGPVAQAAALDGYAATLDSVVRALEQLHAPRVVEAEQRTNTRTFTRIAASARELARVLRRHRNVAPALHKFDVALVAGSAISVQRARIAGIVAFNRRVTRVRELNADAQRERLRLQRSLQ